MVILCGIAELAGNTRTLVYGVILEEHVQLSAISITVDGEQMGVHDVPYGR